MGTYFFVRPMAERGREEEEGRREGEEGREGGTCECLFHLI